MDLDGKTIVISGAGSGIERATALAFAEAGMRAVFCGRPVDRLQEYVRGIEAMGARDWAPRPAM